MRYLIFILIILNLNLYSKETYLECDKDLTKIYLYEDKIIIHCSIYENKKLKKIKIKTTSEKDKNFFNELKNSNFDFDVEFNKKNKIKIIIKDLSHSNEEWLLSFQTFKEINEYSNTTK